MRFLLQCTLKDVRRRLADPMSLAIWLGIPLMLGGLMSVLASGGGPVPKAHVLLVDEDQSFLSSLIANAGGEGRADFLDIERVDTEAEGRRRIDAGDASALLVVPKGFAAAVIDGTPVTLRLVKNPSERILPGIVQTACEMLVEVAFYAQRLLGEPLRQLRGQGVDEGHQYSDAAVAAAATSINDRLRRMGKWMDPPALKLDTVNDAPAAAAQDSNFALLFLPGMVFMAVLFIAQGMADDVWDEKALGTLGRAVRLPHDLTLFLGGKLLATSLVMAAVALVAVGVATAFFAVPVARAPLALAWCVFTGAGLYCYFQVLQFAGTTRTGAHMLSTMVVFPAMMLGGSFFPFEAMPGWMAAIGRWLPNGQAVTRLKDLLAGTADPRALGIAGVAIAVPAIAAFLLSARLMRGRFAGEA